MAIDPRIPLGVQPVQQQPNMLAQYAQIMGIKAAQQEMQGSEDLRAAYASGGDLNDPEFRRRVMAANPKLGSELIKRNAETGKLQNEAILKRIDLSREMLTGVNTPEDYIAWHESNHKDPVLGGYLTQRGVTAEQSRAKIIADLSKPGGLDKLKRESALGAGKLQQELMQTERSVKVANIGAGPGYERNRMQREKDEYERKNPTLSQVQGENGFYLYNPRDPNSAVPLGMRPPAAPPAAAPTAQPSAVNNLMITTQPTPSINALTQPAPNQAGPTVAAANALNQQPTIIRPKQPVRQPVAVIKDGQVTLVPPDQAVGMTPATPGAEKALEKTNIAKEGKESVNRVLSNLYSEYGNLVKSGGITDTRRSVEENISARTGASAAGQLTGSFTGSESQSFRDTIEQTRPLLLTAIMKATGLSATQLNSNVELQTYLKTATDPKVSIQSNVKALNNISQMFGLGEKFDVPEIPKATAKTAKPADAPPAGLSPEIAGLWKYMTPEDRKLWQK
jgi:hypothetical protein